nr:sugar-binding domain-containing protein [Extibacter muris]
MLFKVSKLYYLENKSQQEIANVVGVSRPQVSRILKEAREAGIVEIKLNQPYEMSEEELSLKLAKKLGIPKVTIVDEGGPAEGSHEKKLECISTFAADYLSELIECHTNIGAGWGETIYSTVLKMQYHPFGREKCFVPLVGGAGIYEPFFQTNSIVDRVAEKFKGNKKFINSPAFICNPLVRKYFVESKEFKELQELWEKVDLAFFSVGGKLEQSPMIQRAIGDNRTVERILENSPVGDYLGNFIDENGDGCLPEEEPICVAIPKKILVKVPKRVCIAIGSEKVHCLKVAARNHIYNELITDVSTAEALEMLCTS